MTATKLLHTYRYHDGEWETREPMGPGPTRGDAEALGFEFELWNGTHDDEVEMWGYEGAPGNERRVTLTVRGGLAPTDTLDADPWEGIRYSSRYSAAYKWSYTDAV